MARENNVIVDSVFAQNASTTIPTPPVAGVPYRNNTLDGTTIENGQNYQSPYSSANYNQFFYLLSSVAKTLCENGVMPWVTGQAYADGARALYTDGKLYRATRAILANESPYPEPTYSTAWTCDLDGYLPLSGGTMTGTIQAYGALAMTADTVNNSLRMSGGVDFNNAARIALHSPTSGGNGNFFVGAYNSNTQTFSDLTGNANTGTLYWNSMHAVVQIHTVYNATTALTQNTYKTLTITHATDWHKTLGFIITQAWPATTWTNAGVFILRYTTSTTLDVISYSASQNYSIQIRELYI